MDLLPIYRVQVGGAVGGTVLHKMQVYELNCN